MEDSDSNHLAGATPAADQGSGSPSFGMSDISAIIAEEIDAAAKQAPRPESAADPDKPLKKRPVWLHLIVLFFQLLFLAPVYAGLLAGAGFGVVAKQGF